MLAPALALLLAAPWPPVQATVRDDVRVELPRGPLRLHLRTAPPATSNGLLLVDEDGRFERTNWLDGHQAGERLGELLEAYYAAGGPDVEFVVTHTSFEGRNLGAFYAPIANDVLGIGYRHFGDELFDYLGPAYALEGLLLQNSIAWYDPSTLEGDVYTRVVFGQELAHRWGAFVHARGPGAAVLGRDRAHWSYFLHTGGSPLEGNAWRDNGDGTFTSHTDVLRLAFSDLDLYLMGVLPPEEVAPFFLVERPDTRGQVDDFGLPISASSPPAFGRPVTIAGVRRDLGVEDVVALEGRRSPGAAPSRTIRVAFVLVVRRGEEGDARLRALAERVVQRHKELWEEMTRGRTYLSVHGGTHTQGGPGALCPMGSSNCSEGAPVCLAPPGGGARTCTVRCPDPSACDALGLCCRRSPDGGAGCFPCDPCEGVACPDGLACRDGACVDACAGVACGAGGAVRAGGAASARAGPTPTARPARPARAGPASSPPAGS